MKDSETESADSTHVLWSETSERDDRDSQSSSSSEISVKTTALKKKFMFPYTKKIDKNIEEKQRESKSHLQSSVVSGRSGLQDGPTHQIKSVQSSYRISEPVSNKSNSTDNFYPISSSKRNRPVSALLGQPRCLAFPCSKFHLAQKTSEVFHHFKRQPWVLRVTAFKNGTLSVFAKIAVAPSIKLLLEECTEKLKLNMAARRVFLADGTEALDAADIPHDADIYISTGEPFSNPFKKIKDHLLLMKNTTWTLNGLVLPRDVKRRKVKPVLFKHMKKLAVKSSIRILVFKNCMGQDGYEITTPLDHIEKFLDMCTMRLNLTLPAKNVYNMHGGKIDDLMNVSLLDKCLQNSITPLHGPLWVSKGEGFSPFGAKMYIQGVLSALHQRLKSAKNYCEQLDFAVDDQKEKITIKSILSLRKEELCIEQYKADTLIDELQTAIKSYKGHLSILAPQLQAEQEQCTTYVYKHIKEFSANKVPSQGLQLKVYENGKDTGETLIYIHKKEMESNCDNQLNAVMERLLNVIHQRLQHSANFKPSGLSRFPTRLFDETGQEIKNPLLLQSEQKIWVSYGEDYRSPLNLVLSLTFDRVATAEKDGITIIYKTLLDPAVDLLTGCDNWEICVGIPDNMHFTNCLENHSVEAVDPNNHFMRYKHISTKFESFAKNLLEEPDPYKNDPQMVLLVSVTVENMRKTFHRRKHHSNLMSASAKWPLSNIWLITKAGMILNRAILQSSLAVGHPIRAVMQDGISLEGYKVNLQKRDKSNISQYWEFGNDGCIYSKSYPEFVLTYLEELNVREEVTQMECHTHHGAQSAVHLETDISSKGEVLPKNVSNCNEKQLSKPLDTHLMPAGPSGENEQLTVALVRKLEEKHPKASAQRWAIKHEGTSKPGQWKQSKVDNPLWNKLTYMWPVLPNGELNEAFDWPLEGMLIPNSPPLKKPTYKQSDNYMPLRLRVLRNGGQDKSRTISILRPDSATVVKKQCTMILNLPFAARRLFTEKGVEIFFLRDLERDQLVYVTCGEQWIDPHFTMAQDKKRLQLNNLMSDVTAIRSYCVMRNPKNLALEAKNHIVVGAKLSVERSTVDFEEEKVFDKLEEKQTEENTKNMEDKTDECLNSHAKSHLKTDQYCTVTKYKWQQKSYTFEENSSFQKKKDEQIHETAELYQTYRDQPKLTKEFQKTLYQQFKFRNGKIISCSSPNLVLGVENSDLHSGTEVVLLEQKREDINQYWIWRDDNRTFHLMTDPNLVLAVSMPSILKGDPKYQLKIQGCAVIVQTYKECVNGAANQKWNYMETAKVFKAFYSSILDQEITAANYASICTFCVTNTEKVDQPGYYFLSPDRKKKVMICLACAKVERGKEELRKLSPGTKFFCSSGAEEADSFVTSPFKCLSVKKTNLSTCDAEATMHYLEELLASLRIEITSQTISEKMSSAVNQKTVKIIAYRNGAGYQNGQLIIASTFPMLLSLCTKRLELNRTSCRLYTSEGVLIPTLQDLILWAVSDFFRKQKSKQGEEGAISVPGPEGNVPALLVKDKPADEMNIKCASSVMTPDSLIDDNLLTIILRNPVEVWVSSGEPFLPLDNTLQNAERQERQNWLEKDKIMADLEAMKHKMRQLQGRRIAKFHPASMVPTKSPLQPVAIEGGWTEETQEEMKLMESILHTEMHLSEIQAFHFKRSSPFSSKRLVKSRRSLYSQPTTKRVWVYTNGNKPEQGVRAWGKTLAELLDNCTTQLKMPQPAKGLYTPDGDQLQSWDKIERDMVLCVSTGQPFMSRKAVMHDVEVRALYTRIRKQQGPEATDIIVSPFKKNIGQKEEHSLAISEYFQKNEKPPSSQN
ncbi:doublecortin domain-containing protein 1 [Sphaerodactylus townsendi]|uniref:doublecortin domain-containing protein 1 n=1 Tax=Sphaerodactylus townsendi TaxID=933632 RepID=UPI002026FDF8|nr:doublecortin domain-containing protein 1 [Sphaerodactylus townsendi]